MSVVRLLFALEMTILGCSWLWTGLALQTFTCAGAHGKHGAELVVMGLINP